MRLKGAMESDFDCVELSKADRTKSFSLLRELCFAHTQPIY